MLDSLLVALCRGKRCHVVRPGQDGRRGTGSASRLCTRRCTLLDGRLERMVSRVYRTLGAARDIPWLCCTALCDAVQCMAELRAKKSLSIRDSMFGSKRPARPSATVARLLFGPRCHSSDNSLPYFTPVHTPHATCRLRLQSSLCHSRVNASPSAS